MSLDLLQWPAMLVTVVAAWLVASKRESRGSWGVWFFLASNVLWVAWGLHANAYALVVPAGVSGCAQHPRRGQEHCRPTRWWDLMAREDVHRETVDRD